MTFILVTGTFAVLSLEVDWLLNSEMRAKELVEPSEIAWGDAYDGLMREYPSYDPVSYTHLTLPTTVIV